MHCKDEWQFTLIETKKNRVEALNIFLSFFWKHLYTSKKSPSIDTVLIFTSPKWSFSIPTQRAKRDPREPARHDSTAVFSDCVGQIQFVSTNRPRGTGIFSEVSEMLHLDIACEATWTVSHTQIQTQTHTVAGVSPIKQVTAG